MSSSSILIRKFYPGERVRILGYGNYKKFTGMVLSGPFTQDNKEVYRIRPDFDTTAWCNIRTGSIKKVG